MALGGSAALLGAVGSGLAGPWAIGCLVLVAHATVQVAGPSAALAVPLAATAALLAAATPQRQPLPRGALLLFLSSWAQLLGHGAALAACARTLSATMDYVSGGRYGSWVARHVGLPARASSPDLLAVGVTLVPTLLAALGLEQSPPLRLLLNLAVGGSLVFLVTVGSLHADLDSWGHQDLLAISGSKVLFGAALCSYGFLGLSTAAGRKTHAPTLAAIALLTVLSYCAVCVVLVFMVHFSTLEGSEVPLVKVFEVRDVDWARLVMAVFTILCLGLALLEVSGPLQAIIVSLAGEEWQVLPRALSKESPTLGTPVLAIMTSGCTLSLLAGICPFAGLLHVMSAGPLIHQAVTAGEAILRAYLPSTVAEGKSVRYRRLDDVQRSQGYDTDEELPTAECHRTRRRQQVTVRCLKSGLGLLPSAFRHHVPVDVLRFYARGSVASRDSEDTVLTTTSCEGSLVGSASIESFVDRTAAELLWASDVKSRAAKLTDNPLADAPANGFANPRRSTATLDEPRAASAPPADRARLNEPCLNGVKRDLLIKYRRGGDFELKSDDDSARSFRGDARRDVGDPRSEVDAGAASAGDVRGGSEHGEDEVSDCGEDSTSSSSVADEHSHSSTTDIDAAVEEYKERLKVVATTRADPRPTRTSARLVSAALCGVVACSALLGVATLVSGVAGVWCASAGAAGMVALLATIAWQPRAEPHGAGTAASCSAASLLEPWVPAIGLALDVVLCCQLLASVWHVLLGWMLAGCLLYWWRRSRRSVLKWTSCRGRCRKRRYSCREQIRLQVPPRQSTVPRLIPSHQHIAADRTRRLTTVDTILIAR